MHCALKHVTLILKKYFHFCRISLSVQWGSGDRCTRADLAWLVLLEAFWRMKKSPYASSKSNILKHRKLPGDPFVFRLLLWNHWHHVLCYRLQWWCFMFGEGSDGWLVLISKGWRIQCSQSTVSRSIFTKANSFCFSSSDYVMKDINKSVLSVGDHNI